MKCGKTDISSLLSHEECSTPLYIQIIAHAPPSPGRIYFRKRVGSLAFRLHLEIIFTCGVLTDALVDLLDMLANA